MAIKIKLEHDRSPDIKKDIEGKLVRHFGHTFANATDEEIFKAAAYSLRDRILERSAESEEKVSERKRLYYLSAEFLMGRALINNMINLGVLDEYKKVFEEIGYPFEKLEEEENEAGLGNGGLGRLAACFLDSLSTMQLPATGCGIRYEYGVFKQKIIDGKQVEAPDNWMEKGDVWEVERREEQVEVRYGGTIDENWTEEGLKIIHKNYQAIAAIPYDMPVIGYNSSLPATLKLWKAECPEGFDLSSFNKGDYMCMLQQRELAETISKVLYPEDDHAAGKLLRLKQFYFLSSASIQYIVREHKKRYGDIRTLPEKVVIQINDTHPSLSIPELMRILLDEEHLGWDEAYSIAGRVFNYTNHTVLQEALEVWPEQLFMTLLPRIHSIIKTINDKLCDKLWKLYPGDWDKVSRMSVVAYGEIRMANLCTTVCGNINAVSRLHGEILKAKTFRDFYVLYPDKFKAITNGITFRRWLAVSNPGLCSLLDDYIGEGYLTDYTKFKKLNDHLDNKRFLEDFAEIKNANKKRLSEYVYKTQKAEINPESIFDVQAKRLHEYKRQMLKVLHILYLYNKLHEDPAFTLKTPITFMFGAKASPGYYRAKNIISLINAVARLIDGDEKTRDKIKVVFLENYNVTLAEKLMPAAEISEQISTAGLEASGTGNMKFMLNGAVTLGTMDGANIEIYDQVGEDNIFIFGAKAEEIARMTKENSYNPKALLETNTALKNALNRLIDGTLPLKDKDEFLTLYKSLVEGDYDRADKYFVLYDFESYCSVFDKALSAYSNRPQWTRKAAANTANSGYFSSDRTIAEYNDQIWHLCDRTAAGSLICRIDRL